MIKKSRWNIFHNKISHISLLILIIIILIIIIIFSFVLIRDDKIITNKDKFLILEDKAIIIKYNVEACLKQELNTALELISEQGGYVYKPKFSLKKQDHNIAYNYYLGDNLVPGFEQIENKQISPYIKENLPQCLEKLEIKPDISYDDIQVKTNINKDHIKLNIDLPITISLNNKKKTLNDFSIKQNTSLSILLNTTNKIIEYIMQNPNWMDIDYLKDTYVTYIDDNKIIYKINDPNTDNYFIFAALYNENSPPDLFEFSEYIIRLGETLEIQSHAFDIDNDKLRFSSASDQIEIDPASGLITFQPSIKGEYNFNIRVEDTKAISDTQSLKISVI